MIIYPITWHCNISTTSISLNAILWNVHRSFYTLVTLLCLLSRRWITHQDGVVYDVSESVCCQNLLNFWWPSCCCLEISLRILRLCCTVDRHYGLLKSLYTGSTGEKPDKGRSRSASVRMKEVVGADREAITRRPGKAYDTQQNRWC